MTISSKFIVGGKKCDRCAIHVNRSVYKTDASRHILYSQHNYVVQCSTFSAYFVRRSKRFTYSPLARCVGRPQPHTAQHRPTKRWSRASHRTLAGTRTYTRTRARTLRIQEISRIRRRSTSVAPLSLYITVSDGTSLAVCTESPKRYLVVEPTC